MTRGTVPAASCSSLLSSTQWSRRWCSPRTSVMPLSVPRTLRTPSHVFSINTMLTFQAHLKCYSLWVLPQLLNQDQSLPRALSNVWLAIFDLSPARLLGARSPALCSSVPQSQVLCLAHKRLVANTGHIEKNLFLRSWLCFPTPHPGFPFDLFIGYLIVGTPQIWFLQSVLNICTLTSIKCFMWFQAYFASLSKEVTLKHLWTC